MKGLVFNALNDLVETKFGLTCWDAMIQSVQPANEGAYSGVQTYPDEQLFALVSALSVQTQTPAQVLIRVFGKYLFTVLIQRYPHFRQSDHSLKSFLLSVDEAIHVEVKKLFPNAVTPRFEYEDPSPEQLVMLYTSPRKLCTLAEGLLDGASDHFHSLITVHHSQCMHQGHSHCRLEITFLDACQTEGC